LRKTTKKLDIKDYLPPTKAGNTEIDGMVGKVISTEPFIKLLNNPIWNGKQWECAVQIESTLCLVSVKPFRKKGIKDND